MRALSVSFSRTHKPEKKKKNVGEMEERRLFTKEKKHLRYKK